ncbi:hypothetical protein K432DRAFT_302343, partial [Lepidopterella palustris CBS 459.81]
VTSLGTEISGNRDRKWELSRCKRVGILSAFKTGIRKAPVTREYGCSARTVFNTTNRWTNYQISTNIWPKAEA